jgi:hypothetical protein
LEKTTLELVRVDRNRHIRERGVLYSFLYDQKQNLQWCEEEQESHSRTN